MYSPTLGRFLQTDPIGYGDGMNWYNYVGGDPVNGRDPSGMFDENLDTEETYSAGKKKPPVVCEGGKGPRKCIPLKDENGDGKVDGQDVRAARRYLRIDFAGGPSAEYQQSKQAEINRILAIPNVDERVKAAHEFTKRTGRESGFWIYFDKEARTYSAGQLIRGGTGALDAGTPCGPWPCFWTSAVGFYHTHPNARVGFTDDDNDLASRWGVWLAADHFSGSFFPLFRGPRITKW